MQDLSPNLEGPRAGVAAPVIVAAIALAAAGCAARNSGQAGGAGPLLRPSDFRSNETATTSMVTPMVMVEITETEATEGLLSIEALVGDPVGVGAASAAPPHSSGDSASVAAASGPGSVEALPNTSPEVPAAAPVVVDALVGQINGQPVYASAFLDPLGARLQNMAKETPDEETWTKQARDMIREHLIVTVKDELVLAEAQASLSPEQKKGLLPFIQQIREKLVSSLGGAPVAADETLREESGIGLDAKVKDELDRALIHEEIRRRVASQVRVSWRDVQLEYERDYDKYHPENTAHLRMIWLAKDNTAAVEDVTRRLAGGEPFETVARLEVNLYIRSEGGATAMKFRGELADAPLVAIPELNAAARSLQAGATAGPVEWNGPSGERVGWVHLDRIEKPAGQSLYDVQQQIYVELRERRMQDETRKYLVRLLDQGSFSSLDIMTTRLAMIAADRYYAKP